MNFNLMRFTNSVILVCVLVLTLSGVYGLFWTLNDWLFTVHRITGWALIAAIPWKTAISLRSLRRGLQPSVDRGLVVGVSLLLAAVTLLVLGLGLAWQWRFGPESYPLRQTAISWHWMLALGLLVPFAIHVWRRWPQPKKVDFTSRRAFLKTAGLGAAAVAAWWIGERLSAQQEAPVGGSRPTGSRLAGDHTGNDFPVTHTRAAQPEQVATDRWRLEVRSSGRALLSFTYQELLDISPSRQEATLDCTLGWYTIQDWSGIPLTELLAEAGGPEGGTFVRFESVTGYAHVLPMDEARQVLLATHVGGEPLNYDHGAPLRAVVPTRRGWFWVKWLSRIEVM